MSRKDNDFLDQLVVLVEELSPIEVFVGLPLSMSGDITASTQDALAVGRLIEQRISIPVRLIDERLTTVSAHAQLRSSGKNSKNSRSIVDQIAAVAILTAALDAERLTGTIPGKPLTDFPA